VAILHAHNIAMEKSGGQASIAKESIPAILDLMDQLNDPDKDFWTRVMALHALSILGGPEDARLVRAMSDMIISASDWLNSDLTHSWWGGRFRFPAGRFRHFGIDALARNPELAIAVADEVFSKDQRPITKDAESARLWLVEVLSHVESASKSPDVVAVLSNAFEQETDEGALDFMIIKWVGYNWKLARKVWELTEDVAFKVRIADAIVQKKIDDPASIPPEPEDEESLIKDGGFTELELATGERLWEATETYERHVRSHKHVPGRKDKDKLRLERIGKRRGFELAKALVAAERSEGTAMLRADMLFEQMGVEMNWSLKRDFYEGLLKAVQLMQGLKALEPSWEDLIKSIADGEAKIASELGETWNQFRDTYIGHDFASPDGNSKKVLARVTVDTMIELGMDPMDLGMGLKWLEALLVREKGRRGRFGQKDIEGYGQALIEELLWRGLPEEEILRRSDEIWDARLKERARRVLEEDESIPPQSGPSPEAQPQTLAAGFGADSEPESVSLGVGEEGGFGIGFGVTAEETERMDTYIAKVYAGAKDAKKIGDQDVVEKWYRLVRLMSATINYNPDTRPTEHILLYSSVKALPDNIKQEMFEHWSMRSDDHGLEAGADVSIRADKVEGFLSKRDVVDDMMRDAREDLTVYKRIAAEIEDTLKPAGFGAMARVEGEDTVILPDSERARSAVEVNLEILRGVQFEENRRVPKLGSVPKGVWILHPVRLDENGIIIVLPKAKERKNVLLIAERLDGTLVSLRTEGYDMDSIPQAFHDSIEAYNATVSFSPQKEKTEAPVIYDYVSLDVTEAVGIPDDQAAPDDALHGSPVEDTLRRRATGFGGVKPVGDDTLGNRLIRFAQDSAEGRLAEVRNVLAGFGQAVQVRKILFTTPMALELLAGEVTHNPNLLGQVTRAIPLRTLSEEEKAAVDDILKSTWPEATRAPDPQREPKLSLADQPVFVMEGAELTPEEQAMLDHLVSKELQAMMDLVQFNLNNLLNWASATIKAFSMAA